MPENIPSAKSDIGSLIGTKEILSVIVGKLSSQLLLFSIATIVLLLVSYYLWGSSGLIPTGGILFVFLIGSAGYLFIEQKQKLERGEPKAVNKLLGDRMKNISHTPEFASNINEGIGIKVWTEKIIENAGSRDIKVVPSNSGDTYKIGDKININFSSENDCYLTLLNIGTSGKLTILYPNELHKDNFIQGKTVHKIPGDEYGFKYQLSGPPGTEKLKAIATKEKIDFLEENFSPGEGLFKTANLNAAARDIQIIKQKVTTISPQKWSEAYFEFNVKA